MRHKKSYWKKQPVESHKLKNLKLLGLTLAVKAKIKENVLEGKPRTAGDADVMVMVMLGLQVIDEDQNCVQFNCVQNQQNVCLKKLS